MRARNANVGDIMEMVAMGRQFHENTQADAAGAFEEAFAVERLAQMIRSETGATIVVDGKDGLAGMLVGFAANAVFSHKVQIAQEIAWWVRPEHRSNGVGRALLNGFLVWAKAVDAQTVYMHTIKTGTQDKAEKLYADLGFEHTENVWRKAVN